jgi:hypothetical protein
MVEIWKGTTPSMRQRILSAAAEGLDVGIMRYRQATSIDWRIFG